MKNKNAHIILNENIKNIIDLYWNKNQSTKQIAEQYGIGLSTLTKFLSKYHLLHSPGKNSIKYSVDETYFEKIDSEAKAYWLGVLYADGCIMHIKSTKYIVFSSIDFDWLKQYKDDISFTGPILSEHHKKYDKTIYKVKFTSKKVYRDLNDKGITEAKTASISFPNFDIVPSHLIHHFVRGYFDGDGSVGLYQNTKRSNWMRLHVSFSTGSKEFAIGLYNWLLSNDITPIPFPKKRRQGDVYLLDFSVIAGKKFRDYIYKDATRYLKRKFDIFSLI